jgi:transcriptional regulator GlxA family with amidase domain
MADLCTNSGVSLSTLERIFRRELQVTPSAYILARRLAAARQVIVDGEFSDTRIARIASDHGFGHLGRFSACYRRYFGHSPREAQMVATGEERRHI